MWLTITKDVISPNFFFFNVAGAKRGKTCTCESVFLLIGSESGAIFFKAIKILNIFVHRSVVRCTLLLCLQDVLYVCHRSVVRDVTH